MENPFEQIFEKLDMLQAQISQLLQANNQQPQKLLTKKEYLEKRQISHTTLWREEKRGLVVPEIIGSKKYYRFNTITNETAIANTPKLNKLLNEDLKDMDISVRALNCLKATEIETLGELISYTKSDLMKFRNFGKRSLTELEELVHSKGLNFGFDVARYGQELEQKL